MSDTIKRMLGAEHDDTSDIVVEYGRIPQGTLDVSTYLGCDPSKTLFYHSTSFDPQDEHCRARWSINKLNMLYATILSYTSSVAEDSPLSAICHYDDNVIDYFARIGLLSRNNVLNVGVRGKTGYPYNCIPLQLLNRLKEDNSLLRQLKGFTVIPSYIGQLDVEVAERISGSLLMSPDEQEQFNSKFFYRRMLKDAHIAACTPGAEVEGVANLEPALDRLRNDVERLFGSAAGQRKIWVKMDNQTGGAGTRCVIGELSSDETLHEIVQTLRSMASQIFEEDFIEHNMRFVIELDAGNMPSENRVSEFNVQGVISENKVVLVGSSFCCADENGHFVGNYVSDTLEYAIAQKEAELTAVLSMKAACKKGYRGYMSNDVVVTRNEKTGALRGWIVDPNPRFAASTPLIRMVHKAEDELGREVFGTLNSCNLVSRRGRLMQALEYFMGDDMVHDAGQHLLGLSPSLVCDVNNIGDNLWYTKVASLSTDYEDACRMFENYKTRIYNAAHGENV